MKYLKKYENITNDLTKQELCDYFAHTFDLTHFEIDIAYFDSNNTKDWASNDFSNSHVDVCEGFRIELESPHINDINSFSKYAEIIEQLNEDIVRFKEMKKPTDIFFDNDPLIILIVP